MKSQPERREERVIRNKLFSKKHGDKVLMRKNSGSTKERREANEQQGTKYQYSCKSRSGNAAFPASQRISEGRY